MSENISVLMSVYKKDNPQWFELAVDSVCNQTYAPSEVVLFVDGPIGEELEQMTEKLKNKYDIIRVIRNEQNMGLGTTLQKGINECKYDIIARMDSDDYSKPDRFEKELKCLIENDLDLVGSTVDEFIDNIDNIVSHKSVPLDENAIKKYAKSRNPFCHPTVMYRKSKVLNSGNYQDMRLCEDYDLWIRMLQHGCKVANIEEPLVCMRVSVDLYARRGGYKYFKYQKQLLKYMKKTKFIGFFTYLKNVMIRFCVQVLMPNKLRQKFYMKSLRK